jgi:hypothetical protein
MHSTRTRPFLDLVTAFSAVCRRVAHDTCRTRRQVKQVGKLEDRGGLSLYFLFFDPCRLVRQVKEVGQLPGKGAFFPSSTPAALGGR